MRKMSTDKNVYERYPSNTSQFIQLTSPTFHIYLPSPQPQDSPFFETLFFRKKRQNIRQKWERDGYKVEQKVEKEERWLQGRIEGREGTRMIPRQNRRQRREKDGSRQNRGQERGEGCLQGSIEDREWRGWLQGRIKEREGRGMVTRQNRRQRREMDVTRQNRRQRKERVVTRQNRRQRMERDGYKLQGRIEEQRRERDGYKVEQKVEKGERWLQGRIEGRERREMVARGVASYKKRVSGGVELRFVGL